MSVMTVQTKCKLHNTELFLKQFRIQCKEIGNKYYEETSEFKNLRFRLNNNVRKEIEDSRLNAIECPETEYVRKRSTEF